MELKTLFSEIADAIREKDGTVAPIVAEDFPARIKAIQNSVSIYGVEWDGSSTAKLTRTDDSAGFADPVAAVGDGAGSSPFDIRYPWNGMTRVTQDGNELVAIPKYWVKVQQDPFRVQISNRPLEGFQLSPAHRDRGDGQGERDVVYIGRYECDDSYMSRSGRSLKVSTSLAKFRDGIDALGTEYWQADYALQLTWWFLYLVEFANWDGQAVIGQGNVNSNSALSTGQTDTMVYHTGRAAGTDGQTAVQYRNIENPWGNVREWRDGIVFSGSGICTYNNPSDFKDTYEGAGSTVRSIHRPTKSGMIAKFGSDSVDHSFIYPIEAADSGLPDRCYYASDTRSLHVGGYWGNTSNAGPFLLNGSSLAGFTDAGLGSRIQKLPSGTRLPSGYTELEYIVASGTQYIDTGFAPNQDTGIVLDADVPKRSAGATFAFDTDSYDAQAFFRITMASSNQYYTGCFGSGYYYLYDSEYTGRTVFALDKNVCSIGDLTAEVKQAQFQCPASLLLLAGRTTTNSSVKNSGTIFSCQVYDDGVLIRDYVPCRAASGSVGLYDLANGVFYANAGTGAFAAGPEAAVPEAVSESAGYNFSVDGDRELTALFERM